MAAIASTSRHSLQTLSSAKLGNTTLLFKRTYVAKNPDLKSGRQGFRGKKNDGGLAKSSKRDQNPGAFRPLPLGQLSHPLLQPSKTDELNLPVFSASMRKSMVGKAMVFPSGDSEPFRIFGLPKSLLVEFRILSKPCSVIRDVTLTAIETLEHASNRSSTDARFMLTGAAGSGKSFLLLQAVEYAVSNNWIVLYIPRGVNLVNSTTPHSYDLRTQTYLQPVFSYQTLQRMLTVNTKAFENLNTLSEVVFEKRSTLSAGTPLKDLINVGLRDPSLSTMILEALLSELGKQQKYPVLLAVDDAQALYGKTAYRDPHFASIQTQHLSMPRLLLEYFGGKKSFSRGAVLGAINSSDPVYKTSLELSEALALPMVNANSGPYAKRSAALQEYTKGIRPLAVPGRLAVNEAASMFEVWMKDKALVSDTYDETFLSKYSEASGNARNFVWNGLLSTLAM